jgi:uncharacterized protein YecA (UPF0149 family)
MTKAKQEAQKDPELKGKLNGNCNRRDCQKPEALYYNHSTRLYYCESCANLLNRVNRDWSIYSFGHDLCTLSELVTQELSEVTMLDSGKPWENYIQYTKLPEMDEFYEGNHPTATHPVRTETKIPRNSKCNCGSGLKYKKCCIRS